MTVNFIINDDLITPIASDVTIVYMISKSVSLRISKISVKDLSLSNKADQKLWSTTSPSPLSFDSY